MIIEKVELMFKNGHVNNFYNLLPIKQLPVQSQQQKI